MNNYTLLLLLLSIIFPISCGNRDNHNVGNANSENVVQGNPVISFEKEIHDFGELVVGEKVAYTFSFKNTGNGDLIIKDVKAGCGCTTPQWDQQPIKPEQTGSIEVVFDSSGRKGDQHKTIRVFSNATKKEYLLVITAHVNTDV